MNLNKIIGVIVLIILFSFSVSALNISKNYYLSPSNSNTTYVTGKEYNITDLTVNSTHIGIDYRQIQFESNSSKLANITEIQNSSGYYQIFFTFNETGTYTFNYNSSINATLFVNDVEVNQTFNLTSTSHVVRYNEPTNNYVYFYDAKTSLPLVNNSITITYPTSGIVNLTTDSDGKVEFNGYYKDQLQLGNYTIAHNGQQGYLSPVTFYYNATNLPFNISYNLSTVNLTINIIDTETNNFVTVNSTVSITGIGTFYTTNGTLTFQNTTLVSDEYTVYVSSDEYTPNQKTFTFTNQADLNVSIFVINRTTTNVGRITAYVYDSALDVVSEADMRLQEYDFATQSFTEVGQRFTSSSGFGIFEILLEERSYRIVATKEIDGVTYIGYSTLNGEIFTLEENTVNIYLDTIQTPSDEVIKGLRVNVSNTDLVGNTSFHTVDFLDVNGVDQTVCLQYSYLDNYIEKELLEICEVAASGTINFDGGYLLNTSYVNIVRVYAKEGDYKRYYYEQRYAKTGGFEDNFGFFIKWLIPILYLACLAISLHLKRIDYAGYLSILVSVVFSILAPSYMSFTTVGLNICIVLINLYLSTKRTNANDI